MKIIKDIEYCKNLHLDLYLPENTKPNLFIYFHGGGLNSGSKDGIEVFAKELVENGIAVSSVNYRMYDDCKYPDFIIDAARAIKFLISNKEYADFNKIYVGGSSAGGYISLMLCFNFEFLKAEGLSNDDIEGYIFDAGQPTVHFNVLREQNIDGRRLIVDEKAPLYYVGMSNNYPKMLFIVSTNDIFNRYEQTLLMCNTLRHFDFHNFELKVSEGNHCDYVYKEENGKSVFASYILDFFK